MKGQWDNKWASQLIHMFYETTNVLHNLYICFINCRRLRRKYFSTSQKLFLLHHFVIWLRLWVLIMTCKTNPGCEYNYLYKRIDQGLLYKTVLIYTTMLLPRPPGYDEEVFVPVSHVMLSTEKQKWINLKYVQQLSF